MVMKARALALLLLGFTALPVAGQRIDSPYRFLEHNQAGGVFAALVYPSQGRLGLGPEDAPGVGLRYGIGITGPFAVELEATYSPTTRAVVDTSFTTPDSVPVVKGEADIGLLVAMASIRFNVTGARTWHGLQPFVVFGAGLALDLAGSSAADEEVAADVRYEMGTSFAGQLGAGIEWYPSQRWSLRLDARNALWKLKHPTAFRLGDRGALVPTDEWENHGILSVGLAMHF